MTVQRQRGTGRAHVHEVALRLFARDGVEGTPLQAIADEMGVSKAAVYYHYKTKDELLLGVLAPLLDAFPPVVEQASAQRSQSARADAVVTGLVRLAVDHHARYAVVMSDPYVTRVMSGQPALQELIDLATGPDGDELGRAAVLMFATGLAGTLRDPAIAAMDDETIRGHLAECGRRLLQIRRRPPT